MEEKIRVLLLSLSTINRLQPSNYIFMTEAGTQIETSGNYQLEPIPKLMGEMGCAPDIIIMLCQENNTGDDCTPLVKVPKNIITPDGENLTISAKDYFVKAINAYYHGKKEIKFVDIDINPDVPSEGIRQVVDEIRQIPKEQLELYMDTHGGLRGLQRVLEAVISLLKLEGIGTKEIYGLEYNGKEKSEVFSEKERFRIFEFVSGLTEFDNSGKINSLKKFLRLEKDNLVKAIDEIADGIQWCDVYSFSEGIKKLGIFFEKDEEVSNGYLRIFRDKIRNDYGPLVVEHYVSDEIEWCLAKQFYQQALTLIESKISYELLQKGFIRINLPLCADREWEGYYEIITDDGYRYAVSLNELWNGLVNNCYSFLKPGEEIIIEGSELRLNEDTTSLFSRTFQLNSGQFKRINGSGQKPQYINAGEAISILCSSEINRLGYLHKVIKNIRNKANHGAEFKYDKNSIIRIIKEYHKLLKGLSIPANEVNTIELPDVQLPENVDQDKIKKATRMVIWFFKKNKLPDNSVIWEDLVKELNINFNGNFPKKREMTKSGQKSIISLLTECYPDLFESKKSETIPLTLIYKGSV